MKIGSRSPHRRPVKANVSLIGEKAPHLDLLLMQLFRSLRIAVIYGGDKRTGGAVIREAHNPRSWKSYETVARNIADALSRLGFKDVAVLPDDMSLMGQLKQRRINMAWVNSGGVQGRSAISHAPAMLEMLGIPYVGHDPLTAALLDSKHHFKRQLQSLGIPTAPFFVWHPDEPRKSLLSDRRQRSIFAKWPHGFVVKPVTGRASLHVHYVEHAKDLPEMIAEVFGATQNSVLVEAFLPGREYCIAVCGPVVARRGKLHDLSAPFAFSAIERKLSKNEHIFTSMDVKPITVARTRSLIADTDGDVVANLEEMARSVFHGTPLQTLVRLDVRADYNGNLFVLEANPKPDLAAPSTKSTSLIAAGLARNGMTYDDLILSVFADRAATLFDGRAHSVAQFFQSFQHSSGELR